jgi:hypothetical protein
VEEVEEVEVAVAFEIVPLIGEVLPMSSDSYLMPLHH